MKWFKKRPEVVVLTALGLLTRCWRLFTPAVTVFDEIYFKNYGLDYLSHSYYFDPHPPLVKMIFGFFAWLFGINPINAQNNPALALRIVPALAGVLLIPVFYVFLRQLSASRRIATLGASFILLENALLVESRFILMDSLLILFGIGALSAWLAARKRQGKKAYAFYALAGILAGCAAGTKLTGLTIIGLLGLMWLYDFVKKRKLKPSLYQLGLLILMPLLLYGSMMWGHFHILTHSGDGDAFMSVKFQSTLIGSPYYDPKVKMSFFEKVYDLHKAMYWAEESLKNATHPYASKWYTWPIEKRNIYYWTQSDNNGLADVALFGNPVVWWGTLLIIFLSSVKILLDKKLRNGLVRRKELTAIVFLLVAYAVNWLPFSRIQRIMFLYHYFFALLFSIALAMLLLGYATGWQDKPEVAPWKLKGYAYNWLYICIYALTVAGFIYISPLSYGFMLSWPEFRRHTIFRFWR